MEYARRKVGGIILGSLGILVMTVGPVAAQEGAFHALFGQGYDFLQKKGESSVPLPGRNPVQEDGPFKTLFADNYAVIRAAGQPLVVTKPVADTDTKTSPFEALFGEGYHKIAPGG